PPEFRLLEVGTGAGRGDLREQANVLRVMLGETEAAPLPRRRVSVIETALDDENPQILAALGPRLLEAGALDVMTIPAVMKKGRLGSWLVVICDSGQAETIARVLLTETSTLGVRVRHEERFELERQAVRVRTPFGEVALKVAVAPDGTGRAMPEFESVRDAAERSGRPYREVAEAAIAAWRSGGNGGA